MTKAKRHSTPTLMAPSYDPALGSAGIDISAEQRLTAFDPERTLAAEAADLWSVLRPYAEELATMFWKHYGSAVGFWNDWSESEKANVLKIGTGYVEMLYARPAELKWAEPLDELITGARAQGQNWAVLLSAFSACHRRAMSVVIEHVGDDLTRMERLLATIVRIAAMEAEVLTTRAAQMREDNVRHERAANADIFRNEIVEHVVETSKLSSGLQTQATNASSATRGMLGKTSEVAAAAEQSAMAMRDAAHTAAGLIRAIEDARLEVETAAEVATRASEQAGAAVQVSAALSDTAKSIESILSLIRDVAGQTNLLALNATIEAARAGDAGRGFAVVAQEVKSLANQTARATDDIEAKIAAIQSATRSTVDSNSSIRETVTEVQASAHRIRVAMEMQAQTVTMITAAVDETALAADTMSTTIAAIRADTEEVATEIDSLEGGFDSVNAKLARLQDAASDYVKRVA